MRKTLTIIIILTILSCKKRESNNDLNNQKNSILKIDKTEKPDSISNKDTKYESYLKKDSTLQKRKVDIVSLKNDKSDTLIAFCNCQKNIKQNTIIIQPRIEFPSKSELEKGNKTPTYFIKGPPKQYRFPTIYLKDSTVEKITYLKASQEKQFDNQKFDSLSIGKYKIRISTFNYKIAQNVWGEYELILPEEFGYSKNDTIISGSFHCNNWKIVTYKDLYTPKKKEQYIE